MMLDKACFLDRDGVLVKTFPEGDTTRGPRTLDEIEYLPGVYESCRLLRRAGFKLVCVTNQPDIARGIVTAESVYEVNTEILSAIPLDAFFTCPHDDSDYCDCRKPRSGLLFLAAWELQVSLRRSVMIGDRDSDILAGIRAGCRPCQVTPEYSLLEIAKWICQTT